MLEKYSLHSSRKDKLYESLKEGDLVLMEALPGFVACAINPQTTHINETKKKPVKEDSLFLARPIFRIPVEELQLMSIPSD
jgi:hypothetical protein